MDRLLAPFLAPVLIAQALRLRARALRLPEPPGPRHGMIGKGPPHRLLILGDSSAAGVGASHQDRALSGHLRAALGDRVNLLWRLEARTGATSKTTLEHLHKLPRQPVDTVILVLGVNDVTSMAPQAHVLADRARIADLLLRDFGAPRLLIAGVPPLGKFPLLPEPLRWFLGRRAARLDLALAAQARAAGHSYLPFDMPLRPELMATDGFHPSAQAYHQWAQGLAPHILG